MLAVRKVDALVHAGADDRLAQLLMIPVVKLVPRELAFDFVGDRDEKSRNIVPEKIHELIVGDDDQNVRLGILEIRAQRRESRFGVLAELLPAARSVGRRADPCGAML